MINNENVVTDDWTRNWQAKVAIKITAVFLWVIILGGFCTATYFTKDLEIYIEEEVLRDLDAITHRIQTQLTNENPGSDADIWQNIRSLIGYTLENDGVGFIDHTGILGLRLSVGSRSVDYGVINSELSKESRQFPFTDSEDAGIAKTARLEAFFPPAKKSAEQTRQRLILTVVIVLLVFGMLLSLTIHNILAKPFQVVMDAIQSVSTGNLKLRLDVSRQDEFGHLSRFFNQMLDRVQHQQEELTEANKDLTNEVLVRKEAEQKLRAHGEQLEMIVEERTRDLEIARDQALAASQTKSAFIANISHEIRTPLTPIIGFAEALLQGDHNRQDQDQSLRTIIRNGRHLSHIINEILDLSKIEANCLEIESIPVNVFSVLSDLNSVVEPLAREKGLEFEMDYKFPVPCRITSDPTRIKQILMNLVTNAIKFTDRGHVRISTEYNAISELLIMTVADTGIGIPQEKVGSMFKAFIQADSSTTRQYGGTGLGLHISRRLAQKMGGDITLESVDKLGSRFTLSLSVGDQDKLEFANEPPTCATEELNDLKELDKLELSGRILLAEDSRDIQHLMLYLLKSTGAEVTAVENGQLAVEAVLEKDFDLVLMDMQMPVMGGEEAVTLLRSVGNATPIVALTANAMKEDQLRYKEIGCSGFLSKPINQGELLVTLTEYLPRASSDSETSQQTPDSAKGPELDEIISEFVGKMSGYAAQVESALKDKRYETACELAHQLKGMGGSFGYLDITARAANLETALGSSDYQKAAEFGDELVSLLRKHGRRAEACAID